MTVKDYIEVLKQTAVDNDGYFYNPVYIPEDGTSDMPDYIGEDVLSKEIDHVRLEWTNRNEIVYAIYTKEQ